MKNKWPLAACAMAMLCVAAPGRAQNFVAKLGTATLNDAQHTWVKNYGAALERDSGGRIKAEVYPASQLGTIPRMIEQTQFGSIQLWAGPPEFLYGVDPRFELLTAPGLFKDIVQTNKVLQDPLFAEPFEAIGEKKGLVGVGLFLTGPEAFLLRRPLHKIEDFAGLKIRVLASPMQVEPLRALGASPVPMSLGEVLPALQQGALDGVMGGLPVFEPLGYADAVKYFIDTQHAMITGIGVVSRKWLQSLPPDLQKIVIEDGHRVSAELFSTTVQKLDASTGNWKKSGGEIILLEPKEKERLMALMAPITEKIVEAHPVEKPMYELLKAAIARAGQ